MAGVNIFVDQIKEYPMAAIQPAARKFGRFWCHMWCAVGHEEELHSFASKLGMARGWFQNKKDFPHYDLVPRRRAAAVAAGAQEKDLALWLQERRGTKSGVAAAGQSAPVQGAFKI